MAAPKKTAVAAPAVQRVKQAQAVEAPLPQGALAPGEKHKAAVVVAGKAAKLVTLEYKKKNTHLLHHVHAISEGINTLPEEVFAEAMKHPANIALVKSGDLVVIEEKAPKAKAAAVAEVKAEEPKVEAPKEEKVAG